MLVSVTVGGGPENQKAGTLSRTRLIRVTICIVFVVAVFIVGRSFACFDLIRGP